MKLKQLIDEDFVNYRKPSMFIGTTKCSFKCDKECGMQVCQNSTLATARSIDIDNEILIKRYINNPITSAVVIGGLEPFDTWNGLYIFIKQFRQVCSDDIVIYTGYKEDEIKDQIQRLKVEFYNIIVKFGRYIPNKRSHLDEILGVNLASDNQYARRIC